MFVFNIVNTYKYIYLITRYLYNIYDKLYFTYTLLIIIITSSVQFIIEYFINIIHLYNSITFFYLNQRIEQENLKE